MSAQRLADTTDLPDAEGPILEPRLPPEQTGGRPRQDPRRDVIHGRHSVRRGGGAWRLLPPALPPWQTA